MNESHADTVLEVQNLDIAYKTRKAMISAAREVSFSIERGETLGIVGESGCGKSTVAYGIVSFLGTNGRITGGSVLFEGQELIGRSQKELNALRGNRISMVYQDPMAALNPSVRIGEQLSEVLTCHRAISKTEAWDQSIEMLRRVYMPDPEAVMDRYTHQLSGGQQQRVIIAMAMLNEPSLLIMDEPTTALDVTVEATVLDLVEDLKKDFDTGILFISHNLGVVARVSDKLCVMYAGQVVERGGVEAIFRNPSHPYTKGLLRCVPNLGDDKVSSRLYPIRGRVPHPLKRPENECIYEPRCDYATPECKKARPDLVEVRPGHASRCFYAQDVFKDTALPESKEEEIFADTEPETRAKKTSELLELKNLRIYYEQESKSLASLFGLGKPQFVKAVDDISLTLSKGKTLGIVGESGCGKSTLVKGIIGLEAVTDGEMEFLDLDITEPVAQRAEIVIREMQMVFQNPDATLNPSYTVGKQISRPIQRFNKSATREEIYNEVIRLLKAVRLDASYYDRYPRQLSGGEKQRVGIARALASRPDVVICDEPVSALDVSVQAAVLNLLLDIQKSFGTSLIFIAHDLSVVRFFSDDVAVMYLGQIMEMGPAETIYKPPYHPYTEALLSAVPIPDPEAEQNNIRLSGNVPSALDPPSGCRFHTRCPRRNILPDNGKICETEIPPWNQVEGEHHILCHIPIETLSQLETDFRAE
ncbi:dipeptide ABC transporter ATP-binding protein [candidate division KSB3 bacterium]|uniref:Dipeptide ABC transporter ATP-binding protein n=1 Tax=candidate division KSB3 bacterium TaxID=2044937 RepID=A0A9D5Q7T6_9BACT|nr:dipeptide ABC transporter ATP-binding protein [candidate division KSB3 bacterium]MBD3326236.1 dipeptide ABC transporter ATP-binding protein [candidate division KSB3 bacterium]